MCLYSSLDQPCQHTECQIAVTIYKGSDSYIQNGFTLPKIKKVQLTILPAELQLQNINQMVVQNMNPQSHQRIRENIKAISSRSVLDSQKQDKLQILHIVKKMRKDIRQLKTNQSIIINKMQNLQKQWKQFKQSQTIQQSTSK